jgi:protein-L-isoaspartate(D-aspartate) O-methyltransferase
MNLESARQNMVEQQLRPWEVLDPRVLDVMTRIPRERFVPEAYQHLAFSDIQIPLGDGEVMMEPKVEARLLQALAPTPRERVLEIGTGSGFVTACLAHLAFHVQSVERIEALKFGAIESLRGLGLTNWDLRLGDAAQGWTPGAHYDVIALTGSVYRLPEAYRQALTIGGRLFAIVGEPPAMEARLITRVGPEEWSQEDLFETVLPPLRGATRPVSEQFVF